MNINATQTQYAQDYASCEKNYLLLITLFARKIKAGNNQAMKGYINACRAYGYLAQNKKLTLVDLAYIKTITDEAIKVLCPEN